MKAQHQSTYVPTEGRAMRAAASLDRKPGPEAPTRLSGAVTGPSENREEYIEGVPQIQYEIKRRRHHYHHFYP